MAKFFVGQRVRLARPEQPRYQNSTGTIFFIGHIKEGQFFNGDFCAESDCAVNWDDCDWSPEFLHKLEPILGRHEPCESEFKESLDKLLSEVSREAFK